MIEKGSPPWLELAAKIPAVRVVALVFMTAEEREKLAIMIAEKEKKTKT